MYHKRLIDSHLVSWKNDPDRKPLLLRGARQVGKSSAVRNLAKQFEDFLEVNFEQNRQLATLFSDDLDPKKIVENLSVFFGRKIVAGETLLFFDEIQACPAAISSLRFFYEKMPDLHLIAAGSLLEFALQTLPSYGVGRVRSMFVFPLSFNEFLAAISEEILLESKEKTGFENAMPELLHQKTLTLLKTFLLIGGMPEAVAKFVKTGQVIESQLVLDDLYLAYKTDFAKYKKAVPQARLVEVFESVVQQAGGKFMFKKAADQANHAQIKDALNLLIMAGLVLPVTHTAANGLPLGAEIDPKKRKMILLDTGIFQRILGLNLADFLFESDANTINKGAIAEQFWAMEYLKYSAPFAPPDLYYWHRESANSNAEVDYLVQKGAEILPIEIKSSGKGSMQSLRQFLLEKKKSYGFRFSLENFSTYENVKTVPLYAVSNFVNSL